MVKTHTRTHYTSDKAEGFNLTFEPLEDSISVKNVDKGYEVRYITHDESPEDPRFNDNLGIMACFHNRYSLGDKEHGISSQDYVGWKQMKEALINEHDVAAILPLFLYDHSGITMRTFPFSCPWDSGQVGYIFVTRETLLKEYSVKKLSKKIIERALKVLQAEVEVYDQYLTGDVWCCVCETYNDLKELQDNDVVCGCFGRENALKEVGSIL